MVRNMVGTLLEIGRGKRRPEDISMVLKAKDRRLSGMTAPSEGLTLIRVSY
jgi:tRNA pseudouridine38-40 synthase